VRKCELRYLVIENMRRFLIISRRLDNTLSAPKCSYNLALALAKLGTDVKILTSVVSLPAEDLRRPKKAGVEVVRAPKIFANRFLSPTFYSIYAKAKKEDRVVIGNGYTFGDDITWVHFLRRGALKYLHNILSGNEIRKLRRESYIEELILKSSKKLWAVSSLVKRVLIEEYGIHEDKIFVLHNGIDIEKYHPLDEGRRLKLREILKLPHNAKVLLFVGATPYTKGFHRILHALKLIESIERRNYVLLVAGFDPSDEIQALTSDLNVKFLSKKQEEELITYYQIADIFILPSYYDSFPLASLEAMACGAIPIVTPTVGTTDIIANGVNGFIIRDEIELARILKSMDEYQLMKLRMNTIATARMYSWDSIAKKLIDLIAMREL
jgi:glycosyltransferase involved in cell wall biosynthesis